MRDIDRLNDIFRIMEGMMDGRFSGGYYKPPSSGSYTSEKGDDNYMDTVLNVFNYGDKISITLEVKGLTKDDIDVKAMKDQLKLDLFIDGEWVTRYLKLPKSVKPKSAKTTLKNEVLDICLEIVEEDKDDIRGNLQIS